MSDPIDEPLYGAADPALDAEHRSLREAMADSMLAWASIENEMALLLVHLLRSPDENAGLVIYFAPTATETRFAIVDDMVAHRFGASLYVMPVWAKIMKRLQKHKKTRNKIAHGETITFMRGSAAVARLTGPLFSPGHWQEMMSAMQPRAQIPGMASNELKIAADTFHNDADNVNYFRDFVQEAQGGIASRESLLQRLLELADRLKITLPPDDPTHAISQPLPPPFQALQR